MTKNLSAPVQTDRLRRDHNQDLIRRMRNGESLTSFDSQSSWFPPRPIIAKDSDAIAKLYGKSAKPIAKNETTPAESPKQMLPKIVKLVKEA